MIITLICILIMTACFINMYFKNKNLEDELQKVNSLASQMYIDNLSVNNKLVQAVRNPIKFSIDIRNEQIQNGLADKVYEMTQVDTDYALVLIDLEEINHRLEKLNAENEKTKK